MVKESGPEGNARKKQLTNAVRQMLLRTIRNNDGACHRIDGAAPANE